MRTKGIFIILLAAGLLSAVLLVNCKPINTHESNHFTEDGYRKDTLVHFQRRLPKEVKIFVEVSGSMNGFFRPNEPTQFKTDVWSVLRPLSKFSPEVTILTNDESQGATLSMEDFQTNMNTGAFVSTASTKVPLMLKAIIGDLDTDSDEVAVLISDMKYSPVGDKAPKVLLEQYATEISNIISNFGKSISIIAATSDYVDKKGRSVCDRSPYYYVILGNQENVAEMREYISLHLKQQGHFVDNIESGFNYGNPKCSFGISDKCVQMMGEPTFIDYEEADEEDTCTIRIKIPLEDYRWLMTDEDYFREAFKVKTLYGSKVKVDNISIDSKDITGPDKLLKREATANVDLKIWDMFSDSDEIEWNLELPTTDYTLMNEFFENANDENDPSKSYSVINFLKGVFQGGGVVRDLSPNYILISKGN